MQTGICSQDRAGVKNSPIALEAVRLAKHKHLWKEPLRRSGVTPSARAVGECLADVFINVKHGGKAWPSIKTLATKCNLSLRTTQRGIAALRAAGLIETRKTRFQGPLEYWLRLPSSKKNDVANAANQDAPMSPPVAANLESNDLSKTTGPRPESVSPSESPLQRGENASEEGKSKDLTPIVCDGVNPKTAIITVICALYGGFPGHVRKMLHDLPEGVKWDLYRDCAVGRLRPRHAADRMSAALGFDIVARMRMEARSAVEIDRGGGRVAA